MLNWLRDLTRRLVGNQLFIFLFGLGIFVYIYIYRIGTLVKGLSPAEVESARNAGSLSSISHDPLYGPHKLLQLGLRHIFGYNPTNLRLASAIFAGVFLVCFYLLCVRWFGRLIATVATIFLGALPWVTLLGRNATPSIMLLIVSLLLVSYYWFARSKKKLILPSWLVLCLCISMALYVPGLVWVLLVGTLINRRSLIFSIKKLSVVRVSLGLVLILILISPLTWSLVKTPSLLHHWLLIPTQWIGFEALAKNLAWALGSLFVHLRSHIDWMVGRQPVFTILITALSIFGGYAMSLQARQKLYALLALIIFGALASAVNGNYVYLSFALVPMAILCAAGIRYLFLQWQSVFPRNPIPRYFAYSLILLLALSQFVYGARSTLYAWPHTSETKTLFVLK